MVSSEELGIRGYKGPPRARLVHTPRELRLAVTLAIHNKILAMCIHAYCGDILTTLTEDAVLA